MTGPVGSVRRKLGSLSIFWKLALPTAALILLSAVIAVGVAYWRTTAALDEEMHSRVMARTASLGNEVEFLLQSEDPAASERLEAVLSEPAERPERLYAYIEDADGDLVIASGEVSTELLAAIRETHANEGADEHAMSAGTMEMAGEDGHGAGAHSMVTFDLDNGPEVMDTSALLEDGYVLHTGHTTDQMRAVTLPVVGPLVGFIGLTPLLTVALLFLITRSVTAPIRTLTAAAGALQRGDYGAAVPVRSRDEVGTLARAFNDMSAGLAERARLEHENRRLSEQVVVDGLTGLFNHRYLQERLGAELDRASRDGTALSVIMTDVDDFKLFNDTYGHPVGDDILRLVADTLVAECGEDAISCRYGGDEFLIILPGSGKDAAGALAERLAARIDGASFETVKGTRLPIRVSLGVAAFPHDADSKNRLLAQADGAMYEAKRGRGASDATARIGSAQSDVGLGALDSLIEVVERRDHYTRCHSDVTAEEAARLALRCGLSEEVSHALRLAGVLHDIGKIIVPDAILRKPGPLTAEEYRLIKRHPSVGEVLIREMPSLPFLETVVQAVLTHHERYDGLGYPQGLRGEEIPIVGRVIAIADAYSAMALDRPYRKALARDEIVAELEAGAGRQFDPQLVELFTAELKQGDIARAA